MTPNAWKSISVILLTALAIWYASTVDPWGVLLGLAVCWRYLIGDKSVEATQSCLADAQFDTSYVCQGSDEFLRSRANSEAIQAIEEAMESMAIAKIAYHPDMQSYVVDMLDGGADRAILGDRLIAISDALIVLEQYWAAEQEADRDEILSRLNSKLLT